MVTMAVALANGRKECDDDNIKEGLKGVRRGGADSTCNVQPSFGLLRSMLGWRMGDESSSS